MKAPRRVAELYRKNQRCVELAALNQGLSKGLKSQRFYVIWQGRGKGYRCVIVKRKCHLILFSDSDTPLH